MSKTTVRSKFTDKKRIFFSFPDIEQKTFCLFNKVFRPDCQICSLRPRWNTFGEKVHFFARFWGSQRKIFRHLVEWFRQSCRNSILIFKREISMKIALFEENVGFPISFPKNQQKMIFQYVLVFRRCFQSCFQPKMGSLEFFFTEGVWFTKNLGDWMKIL